MSVPVPMYGFGGVGGTSLNFDVKAYATEETLLAATPKENTIGIITETPITSYIFSATEPSPAAAGMVWISTGTSSTIEFNALKKNGIQVYPLSAKQYVSDAWVDAPVYIYQNNAWESLQTIVTIFDRETQSFDEISGNLHRVNDPSMTLVEDSYPFIRLRSGNLNRGWQWSPLVDFTEYSVLEVIGYADSGRFGIATSLKSGFDQVPYVTESASMNFTTYESTHRLDISEITGSGYIGFYIADTGSMYIKCVNLIS